MALSKIFSIIAAFIFLSTVFCGSQIQALELGLKAGISASNQSYEYSPVNLNVDRLRQAGFAAGVFFGQGLGPLMSIRIGVDYIQKGSAIEFLVTSPQYPLGNGTQRLKDQIEYLSFNLLATPSLLNLKVISPYVIAGPRVDVLLSSESPVEIMSNKNFESTVFGASIGVGVRVSAIATSLFVEAVYQPDFTDAFKIQSLTIRNNSFLITAGLVF